MVSYIDVVQENLISDKHTFQVILASNGSVTYGIFNYQQLSQSYAVTGASEQLCSWRTFSKSYGDDLSRSNYLVDQSNIGIQGRFVFELTSQDCENRGNSLFIFYTSCSLSPCVCWTSSIFTAILPIYKSKW